MKARVISNQGIEGHYFKLLIKLTQKISYLPGQFVMIRPSDSTSSGIFLPRPFSIHILTEDNQIGILYKVVGRGTEFLSRLGTGSEIDVCGPFGNGFDIDTSIVPDEFIIVAGGIGVAPLPGLSELIRKKRPEAALSAFVGGRGSVDILCTDELERLGASVVVSTEDGSAGIKGYVTDALEGYLMQGSRGRRLSLYACGPNPMLKRIYDIVGPYKLDTYFSMEASMACGMGLCMGCAVKKRDGGYYLVCKDGPVFNGNMIDLRDET